MQPRRSRSTWKKQFLHTSPRPHSPRICRIGTRSLQAQWQTASSTKAKKLTSKRNTRKHTVRESRQETTPTLPQESTQRKTTRRAAQAQLSAVRRKTSRTKQTADLPAYRTACPLLQMPYSSKWRTTPSLPTAIIRSNMDDMMEMQIQAVGYLEKIERHTSELPSMNQKLEKIRKNTEKL